MAALPEHTLLPPEPVLCAEYGVSRITLRRAVDGLVADGHLVREQGRGTYVTRPAIRHEYRESFVHRIAGFSSVMSEQGAQVGTKVLTQRVVPVPATVAAELAIGGRQLQNRLRAEGTSYRQLLDQVRKGIALDVLERADVSIYDVAFLVGFAQQSAFTHAFRRWTGLSPGEYRRQAGESA